MAGYSGGNQSVPEFALHVHFCSKVTGLQSRTLNGDPRHVLECVHSGSMYIAAHPTPVKKRYDPAVPKWTDLLMEGASVCVTSCEAGLGRGSAGLVLLLLCLPCCGVAWLCTVHSLSAKPSNLLTVLVCLGFVPMGYTAHKGTRSINGSKPPDTALEWSLHGRCYY